MDDLRLCEVAVLVRFRCAVCGRRLTVQQLEEHAAAHARHGECLNYSAFAQASDRNSGLEGLPAVSAAGEEVVWPFELVAASLRRACRPQPYVAREAARQLAAV